MTVAAVILAASPASALADAAGTPAVRRIADAAWAGGATPVVVVAQDPDGLVEQALATAEVTILEIGALGAGPAVQIARGLLAAVGLVGATTGALVWPARFAWADAETVTTLLQTHGEDPAAILRPAHDGVAGWPALLPLSTLPVLDAGAPDRQPDALLSDLAVAGIPTQIVDTGDPGVRLDVSVPQGDLPPFDGPPRPNDGLEREWGAPAAVQSDEVPPAGPARVPNPDPAR